MVWSSKKQPKRLTSKQVTRDEIEEELNRDIDEEGEEDNEEYEDDEEEEKPKKKPKQRDVPELNYSEWADIVEGNLRRAFGSFVELRQHLKI